MDYWTAQVWHTRVSRDVSTDAVPLDADVVDGRRVVHLKGAMYRGSVFDGTFLLSETVVLPLASEGKQRVKFECCWYGHRLKQFEPKFLIDLATSVVDEDYKGEVFTNLGKRLP